MTLEDTTRLALLLNDISLEFRVEPGKTVLKNTLDTLRQVERQYPDLEKYLTPQVLQVALRTDLKGALTSFMQEPRQLIAEMEGVLTSDGVGRPAKAARLLVLMQNPAFTEELQRLANRST